MPSWGIVPPRFTFHPREPITSMTSSTSQDTSEFQKIREIYLERRQRFEAERDAHGQRARLISTARLFTFVAAVAGIIYGFWGLRMSSPESVLGGFLSFVAFVALVLWHDRVLRTRDRSELLIAINDEALLRMERKWSKLPKLPAPEELRDTPMARDLDLFPSEQARASVFQLLGTVNTPQGRATLAQWLIDGSKPSTIEARQKAVQELAARIDFRQELDVRGRQLGEDPPDPATFFEWAEGEPWLHHKPILLWLTRLLGVTAVTLAVLRIFGMVPTGYLVLSILVNLGIAFAFSSRIMETYNTISGREHAARHYAGLFQLLHEQKFESKELRRLDDLLRPKGRSVTQHMKQLERLGGLADTRFTPLFHIPLVALTLWDFHVLWGFERWQNSAGPRVRTWFNTLGELESINALATLHHDHPDWSFPVVDENRGQRIEAEALGHPLLPPAECVRNDVTLGPPGKFLLVTGSNMSGKSTLLRSIGTNVVLAQIGAPVCAVRLELPPVAVASSFRVHDSLEAGVSFFMAELRRLKAIVEQARELYEEKDDEHPHLLFLLDEILQGTNVYERQVAVRRVILHLLHYEAIGAVSTHDLTLAETDELADACDTCHFTESYEHDESGPKMSFDYKLRPGVSSTVNALKLLEVVGLGEDRIEPVGE